MIIPKPTQAPFLESWIYDYGLLDELAINAYWAEKYDDSAAASEKILKDEKIPSEQIGRIKENLDHALRKKIAATYSAIGAGTPLDAEQGNLRFKSTHSRRSSVMQIQEWKEYSQNGEDGIIASIFSKIGMVNRTFVEIGCDDGLECNTRRLSKAEAWTGIRIDAAHEDLALSIYRHFVDAENACSVLRDLGIPQEFDLLSLDIDYNDFHVLHAILRQFRPRVVVVEYNSSLGPTDDCVVPYDPKAQWDGTNYFGASYAAFVRLGEAFNYNVIFCDSMAVNLFMVRADEYGPPESSVYRSPRYGSERQGHRADDTHRKYLTSAHYLMKGVATASTRFGRISYLQKDIYIGAAFSSGRYWEEANVTFVGNQIATCRGLALDIGAHIGSHSIALARLNPRLLFICFEPQHSLFLLLERNICENNLSERIEARHCAVGHRLGKCSLSDRIFEEETGEQRSVSYVDDRPLNLGGMQLGTAGPIVDLITIDSLCLPRVAYIKLDVEGAEPLVFYGMEATLGRDLPFVHFEDRADRRLDDATLEQLEAAKEINIRPADRLSELGYRLVPVGLDYLASPPRPPHDQTLPSFSHSDDRIPKIIFQTWKTKVALPGNFEYWSSTFSDKNPNYDLVVWDDSDNRKFITRFFEFFLPIYDSYSAEIYRADAVRYFFLYVYGGLYADMDVECLRALDDVLQGDDIILGRMGADPKHPHSIPNAIMASKARCDFWLLVIWLLRETRSRTAHPEFMTGPVLLKSAVDLYLARDPQWVSMAIEEIGSLLPSDLKPLRRSCSIKILSSREWYALDWTDPIHQRIRRHVLGGSFLTSAEKNELFPTSSLVTYWSHSWG